MFDGPNFPKMFNRSRKQDGKLFSTKSPEQIYYNWKTTSPFPSIDSIFLYFVYCQPKCNQFHLVDEISSSFYLFFFIIFWTRKNVFFFVCLLLFDENWFNFLWEYLINQKWWKVVIHQVKWTDISIEDDFWQRKIATTKFLGWHWVDMLTRPRV